MAVTRDHLQSRSATPFAGVGPEKLSESILKGRYCFENFLQEPFCTLKGSNAAPAGTALTENLVNTGRYTFEYTFLGEHTAGLYPLLATDGGYDWALDGTDAEGVEINFGGLKASHPRVFTPSSEDFFARILLNFEDASGVDAFFGVRKVAAYAATLTEYADVLGVRILGDSSSTTAAFTVINGATDFAEVATSVTGLEDATAVELEIRSIGGVGFLFVNGTQIASKTFVSAQSMSPVARLLNTTDVAGTIKTLAFECGLLKDRAAGTLLSLAGATA